MPRPTTAEIPNAIEVTQCLENCISAISIPPQEIQSDNGSHFISDIFR